MSVLEVNTADGPRYYDDVTWDILPNGVLQIVPNSRLLNKEMIFLSPLFWQQIIVLKNKPSEPSKLPMPPSKETSRISEAASPLPWMSTRPDSHSKASRVAKRFGQRFVSFGAHRAQEERSRAKKRAPGKKGEADEPGNSKQEPGSSDLMNH